VAGLHDGPGAGLVLVDAGRDDGPEDDAPPPYYVDIWWGHMVTATGVVEHLLPDDVPAVVRARRMAARFAAGKPRPDDVDVNGWTAGEARTTEFGLNQHGQPKIDMRWMAMRPPVERFPQLVAKLRMFLDLMAMEQLFAPPQLRPTRAELAEHPAIRRILRVTRHPRIALVLGTASRRAELTVACWRREYVVAAACAWCGLPTHAQCYGTTTHYCGKPLCVDCCSSLGRCASCCLDIGVVTARPRGRDEFDDHSWPIGNLQPLLAGDWTDIWDGVSRVPPVLGQ